MAGANKSLMQRQGLIVQIITQIWLNIKLMFSRDSLEVRLEWLRYAYYTDPALNISYRRVKEVLRGYVKPEFYPVYDRFLSSERSAHQLTEKLPRSVRGNELMEQMQRLGNEIAHLIEQVQAAEETHKIYPDESQEAQTITETLTWLNKRIQDATNLHAGIPARLLSLSMVKTGRDVDKMNERINRLTQRLDDIADSYAEIAGYSAESRRSVLENEIERAIHSLESNDQAL